jgi:antitoxin component YwqK of YwqJK toxin-antitoxin module
MKGKAFIAVFLGVIVVAVALLLTLRRSTPVENIPEVARTNLHQLNGKLVLVSNNLPFTGKMVEHYASGLVRSSCIVSNGLLSGLARGWHTNGQLEVEENFTNGVSHGLRIKWHENGLKAAETMIVAGKVHGKFRRWNEQGQLVEEMELKDGTPDGLCMSWYASGCLKSKATLKAGAIISQEQWKDGERPWNSAAPAVAAR